LTTSVNPRRGMEVRMDAEALGTLDLPTGTHAAVLTGHDVVSGEQLAYPVVWADRPYDTCPRCRQPVARVVEQCPVMLDTGARQGGQILEYSKQHGCGEWLSVDWDEVRASDRLADITDDDVAAAARLLAARLAETIASKRDHIRMRLREDLQDALRRLAEPLEDDETAEDRTDEVRTGSEVEPGIYQEGGEWVAWDYDPAGSGDTIAVHESDLAPAARSD
jgi:hypothetical protein